MLRLFNSLGKRFETFRPVQRKVVNIFTCGPSVYQKPHIGNYRTFLFEDILVRYLVYSGYAVRRGMNLTDIEDKTIKEALKHHTTVARITDTHIREFVREMKELKLTIPDYLPRASECVSEAIEIIEQLLALKIAYWYKGNVYFDPLQFPRFGKLYGLDMSEWPATKKRFHQDTYPGIQWNLGDFILWHGHRKGEPFYWDTKIGKGRPSWNIQDPGMISKYFHETLSIYCGGIDNLYRHHDYTLAILESVRPYPMAKYWLHCEHLFIHSGKMSKSKGNAVYVDTLRERGYTLSEIRFSLIYGRYRERLHYSDTSMQEAANILRGFRTKVKAIERMSSKHRDSRSPSARRMKNMFADKMDNNLNVKDAFDGLYDIVSGIDLKVLKSHEAGGIITTLQEIDEVLKVIF
jgi:cysteinyl-tRNA synthetase